MCINICPYKLKSEPAPSMKGSGFKTTLRFKMVYRHGRVTMSFVYIASIAALLKCIKRTLKRPYLIAGG
jgi:hypothetical protein